MTIYILGGGGKSSVFLSVFAVVNFVFLGYDWRVDELITFWQCNTRTHRSTPLKWTPFRVSLHSSVNPCSKNVHDFMDDLILTEAATKPRFSWGILQFIGLDFCPGRKRTWVLSLAWSSRLRSCAAWWGASEVSWRPCCRQGRVSSQTEKAKKKVEMQTPCHFSQPKQHSVPFDPHCICARVSRMCWRVQCVWMPVHVPEVCKTKWKWSSEFQNSDSLCLKTGSDGKSESGNHLRVSHCRVLKGTS